MGPIVICDKSTVQGLSTRELNQLRRNYLLNIPPILLLEILADLKKSGDTGSCRVQVQELANKLVPFCSTVNVSHRHLVVGEICGEKIDMRYGRPIINPGRIVTSHGKSGIVLAQGPEEEALLRWQVGEFSKAEELLADAWRATSRAIDLEAMQRILRKNYAGQMHIGSLDEAASVAESVLRSETPSQVLRWFLKDCEIDPDSLPSGIEPFDGRGPFFIHAELPYTVRCIRLALIFHFGLAFGLISTRVTNRLDLEYLYYVPFCNVFSSGDALHHKLLPFVLGPNQMVVKREPFKADLAGLAIWWSSLSDEEKEKERQRSGPPVFEHSLTFQIWTKFMKPGWRNDRLKEKLSSTAEDKMFKHVSKLLAEAAPGTSPHQASDDCDFLVKRQFVRFSSPCICGSDKTFRDCCGRELAANA
jgi:hypothetical protein